MPIREYACRDCGDRFEVLERTTTDRPAAACPQCGGRKVERLLSVFASPQAHAGAERSHAGADECPRCGLDGPCRGL